MMPLNEKLQFVRRKLNATDVPFQLRLISYVRISCFALDPSGGRYAKLMRALHNYQLNWWETCSVAPTGELQSSDPIISDLLAPLEALYSNEPVLVVGDLQPVM